MGDGKQVPGDQTTVGALDTLAAERPFDGILRRTIAGQSSTVVVYELEPGAEFPLHAHAQEQTTLIEAGQARFVSGDTDIVLNASGWSVVPPGISHQIIAGPEGARFVAIVAPARASGDYRIVAGPTP